MFEAIGSIGKLIGGLGQAYGSIEQARMGKKLYDLQKDMMNRGIKKENKLQANLDEAVASTYTSNDKNKNNLVPQLNLGV